MGQLLQKTLRNEIKEGRCVIGTKQALGSLADSKLLVLSRSVPDRIATALVEAARKHGVQTIRFSGTSMALGRLCGLQFRVSVASFSSLAESSIRSIVSESQGDL